MRNSETTEWLIKQYGFDVIQTARDCYMSRNDHIDISQYQFSNDVKNILSIIQNQKLSIAHAELIHLKKQILDYFKSQHITDPVEQKNFILKNFNCDIIEIAQNIYMGRRDHKTLASFFKSTNIQKTIIKMLYNDEHSYISLAHELCIAAHYVFRNAMLCDLTIDPNIKSNVFKAIDFIKKSCNSSTFMDNITTINSELHSIQKTVYAIIDGEPIQPKESTKELIEAAEWFITRLNTIPLPNREEPTFYN